MTNVSISSQHLFPFFFQRTDSLKSCLKQPQSYLKRQKIEIKVNLEILFYTVFIGKLEKLHLFKSSSPEMLYKKGALKNLSKFTGNHLCQSLIRYNIAACCFCFLLGIYKG